MKNKFELYDLLLDNVPSNASKIQEIVIGLTWTYCQTEDIGLCMTADTRSRTLPWSGQLTAFSVQEITNWIRDWDPIKSTIALATINSFLKPDVIGEYKTVPVTDPEYANLSIFHYFLPAIKNKKSVVIGRYPGLETIQHQCNMKVIELNPSINDYPAAASEFLIAEADWVFVTGTSIANKTFPRILELAKYANVVLMGPSVPWLKEFASFGVDFLAGTVINNNLQLKRVVSEGGGVNLFNNAVQYAVCDLGENKLVDTKKKIQDVVNQRESLNRGNAGEHEFRVQEIDSVVI